MFWSYVYNDFIDKFKGFFQFRKFGKEQPIKFQNKDVDPKQNGGVLYKSMNFKGYGSWDGRKFSFNYGPNSYYTESDTQYRDFMMEML